MRARVSAVIEGVRVRVRVRASVRVKTGVRWRDDEGVRREKAGPRGARWRLVCGLGVRLADCDAAPGSWARVRTRRAKVRATG